MTFAFSAYTCNYQMMLAIDFIILLVVAGPALSQQQTHITDPEVSTNSEDEGLRERVFKLEQQQKYFQSIAESMNDKFDKIVLQDKSVGKNSFPGFLHRSRRQDETFHRNMYARSADPDVVGFSAELSHELTGIDAGRTIVFDNKLYWSATNVYDNTTGIFTCPTSGLYLFAVFIESAINREASVMLRKEEVYYLSIISEPSEAGEDDTGGNVIMLPVEKGQRVWVEARHYNDQSFYPYYTTFTGVMIHRTH